MRQYHSIKGRYPHALVLFRLGDFYELFYEDAIAASRELQITLTSRNRERGEPDFPVGGRIADRLCLCGRHHGRIPRSGIFRRGRR
jgi:DNA mismatch repair ATPase MutS